MRLRAFNRENLASGVFLSCSINATRQLDAMRSNSFSCSKDSSLISSRLLLPAPLNPICTNHDMPKLDETLLARARPTDLIQYLQAQCHKPVSVKHQNATFHSPLRIDRHPSFSVIFKDSVWKWTDFGTGEYGDGIDLLMRLHRVDFQQAVSILLDLPINPSVGTTAIPPKPVLTQQAVQRIYHHWKVAMTPEREFLIRQYFLSRELAFPEGLGIIYLESPVAEGLHLPYVAIPSPSAIPRLMTSLECRCLDETSVYKPHRRRTIGEKSLWVVRRPCSRLLVTESILDCLAGGQLLRHRLSLCALNSIVNVSQLLPCVRQLRPTTVYLAMDCHLAQPDQPATKTKAPDPGPAAQEQAKCELLKAGYRVVVVRHHQRAGVKDLHRLLLQHPRPISFDELEQEGEVFLP